MHQGLLEPGFCGALVCGLRKIVGSGGFLAQLIGVVSHCWGIGYGVGVLQRTACFVIAQVMVGGLAVLFGYVRVGRASDSVAVPAWGYVYWWGGGD